MVEKVQLGWTLPTELWNNFCDHVEAENGELDGYISREVGQAMREYIGNDGLEEIEQRVDDLVQAAGRTPAELGEKKTTWNPPEDLETDETTQVWTYVDKRVKKRFKDFVRTEYNLKPGLGLTAALRVYIEHGRVNRLADKLDRVVDDATKVLSELNASSSGGLTGREKKRLKIRRNLPDEFTHADLEAEITAVAGETVVDDYVPKVLEELDYTEHPGTREKPERTLYVPKGRAEEIARERAKQRRQQAEEEIRQTEANEKSDVQLDLEDATAIPETVSQEPAASSDCDAESETNPTIPRSKLELFEGMSPEDVRELGHKPDVVRNRLLAEGYDASALVGECGEREDADERDTKAECGVGVEREPSEVDQEQRGGTEQPSAVRADGGVVTNQSAPSTPPQNPELERAASVTPVVECTCCGSIIPNHIQIDILDGVARKECPTCGKFADVEKGVTPGL